MPGTVSKRLGGRKMVLNHGHLVFHAEGVDTFLRKREAIEKLKAESEIVYFFKNVF